MRILRSYVCIAQSRHWCDCCHHDIQPGECYEGIVWADGKDRFMVIKQHYSPPCEPEPDPFDEDFDDREDSEPLQMPQRSSAQTTRAA